MRREGMEAECWTGADVRWTFEGVVLHRIPCSSSGVPGNVDCRSNQSAIVVCAL